MMFDQFDDSQDNQDSERTIRTSPAPDAPEPPVRPNQQVRISVPTVSSQKAVNGNASAPIRPPRATIVPTSPPPLYRESAARERMRRRRGRGSGGEWAWVIIAGTLLGVVLITSLLTMLLFSSAGRRQTMLPTAVADRSMLPTAVNLRVTPGDLRTGQNVTLADGRSIILEPWDGESRFTLLAMGLDRRPDDRGIAHLTDTMMLISIDPATQSIGILSIPRDLYVEIPGFSQLQRINTAMVLGENTDPGTGPLLAMQTVQYNLGIRVNDYVLVDFKAVTDLVDAIGGIDVTIDYTINDRSFPDMYYGYDPFYLAAGTHHLDGATALKFARTRHGDSDIDRAGRQQQVIYAVRDRILNLNMLPQLIVQAPALLRSWEDNVYTSMSVDQMIELAWYVKDIPMDNMRSGVIDFQYVSNYMTPRGEAVLIPNRTTLGNLMVEIFGESYNQ